MLACPFLLVEFLDRCRCENNHANSAAALLAPVAPPPVLADAATTALLAAVAHPPVLADAAAAALLALAALPPVLANAAAAALLAHVAPPAVRTGHASSETPDAKRYPRHPKVGQHNANRDDGLNTALPLAPYIA